MGKSTDIHFRNNLIVEKRDMNVYHSMSKGIHFISHGSSVTIPLLTVIDNDFIYLSVAIGPGFMERRNIIELPSWINYEFKADGRFSAVHIEDRIYLEISAGLPEWKLKLTLPASHRKPSEGRVIVSDDHDR